MKGNKLPDIDHLSVEFYKIFWCEIGDLVVVSLNEAFTNGALTETMNTSVVTLIFKKGDRANMKNYRPMSLTNTDYKLLAHILANRIHQELDKIISIDQTSYIKIDTLGPISEKSLIQLSTKQIMKNQAYSYS